MRVHAIQTGFVAVKRRHREGEGRGPFRLTRTLADQNWTERLPIYAWLIEHSEGLIVIDTGETSRVSEPGYFPRWHPNFKIAARMWVEPEEEIGPRMAALGFSCSDVRWVIMTHLHTDHAGGLRHFPDCEILVCRSEFDAARGIGGQVRGFLPHRWPTWFTPSLFELGPEQYGPFGRSTRVTKAGDLTIVATPGHTKGHVSVVLEEDRHLLFFAGDAAYSEALMLAGAVDGVSLYERAARTSLTCMQALARERTVVYLPSHDPHAASRLTERRPVSRGIG